MTQSVRTARYAFVCALACVTVAACQSGSGGTQTPVPATGGAALDAETRTLMARLAALSADSMEGRRAGTEGHRKAQRWVARELSRMAVEPLLNEYGQVVRLPARPGSDTIGGNVIARVAGSRPGSGTIVMSAHLDHLGVRNGEIYNGADDDASGCVALITIAERVKKAKLAHDVVFLFADAEESGMHGSKQFVASGVVPTDKIVLNINLDMVARQDGKALWVSGLSHYPVLRPIAEEAARGASIPIKYGHDTNDLKPGDDWTNSSDHASFRAKGVKFLYLGVEDHPDYHRPGDDAEKVDPLFYRGAVEFTWRLLQSADQRLK